MKKSSIVPDPARPLMGTLQMGTGTYLIGSPPCCDYQRKHKLSVLSFFNFGLKFLVNRLFAYFGCIFFHMMKESERDVNHSGQCCNRVDIFTLMNVVEHHCENGKEEAQGRYIFLVS